MDIRSAEPHECPAIAQLSADSWRAAYTGIMDEEVLANIDVERREKGLRNEINQGNPLFVALQSNQIVGFCHGTTYRENDPSMVGFGEIVAIYVTPTRFGQGIGTALIRETIEHMRNLDLLGAALWTLTENKQAISFYNRCGFKQDGAEKKFGDQGMKVHRYILRFE